MGAIPCKVSKVLRFNVSDVVESGGRVTISHRGKLDTALDGSATIEIHLPDATLDVRELEAEIIKITDPVAAEIILTNMMQQITRQQLAALFK